MGKKFKILDVAALLEDIPDKNLVKGQVGTIVEELPDNNFEVEFINKNGETIAMAAVNAGNLLLLHYELEIV
jgi:hypothetical protein